MKIKTFQFSLNLIIFLCSLCFNYVTLQAQTVSESDSLALVTLYKSTNGDNWTRNDNWLEGPINTWYGISIHDFRISKINLRENSMTGKIPAELGNLTYLQTLDLRFNQLTGNIPVELGNLRLLEELLLISNKLIGPIPKEIGNLGKLNKLWLGGNSLNGSIPRDIGNLSQLNSLWLFTNKLSGVIPSEIGNLSNLQELLLGDNQFVGIIPQSFENLRNLESLYLAKLQLSGNIPSVIFKLKNLSNLNLSQNKLSGTIPIEITQLTKLSTLNLNYNNLSGPIPAELSRLSNLAWIALSNNRFTGEIPTSFVKLSQLNSLDLSHNQLTGSIPKNLGTLPDLIELNFTSNQLDYLPKEIVNSTSLQVLHLKNNNFNDLPYSQSLEQLIAMSIDQNQLTFEHILPYLNISSNFKTFNFSPQDSIGQTQTITLEAGKTFTINLGIDSTLTTNKYRWFKDNEEIAVTNQNSFEIANFSLADAGVYSAEITNPEVTELTLYSRPITINVTSDEDRSVFESDSLALVAFYNSTNGENWVRKDNWLLGPVETWEGVTIENKRVVKLQLIDNNLTGELTAVIGELTALRDIRLSFNSFTGSLPKEIGNLTELTHLSFSPSTLTGSIPKELGNLGKLESIWLASSKITGKLPPEIGNLKSLINLNLYLPNVTGAMPSELGKLTNLKAIRITSNFSGSIPKELGNLDNLEIFFLSSPTLSGSIPPSLGNLSKLRFLEIVDCNQLGPIPAEIGKLKSLIMLGLHGNKLSGPIPEELSNLKNLKKLDLSDNQLDGKFPAQLSQLSELEGIFIQNNHLKNLPDFTSLINLNQFTGMYKGSQSGINVEQNNFTFKDILANQNLSDSVIFIYAPQDSIGQTQTITLGAGKSFTINLGIDSTLTTNEYRWLKDHKEIAVSNQNSLIIKEVTPADAGVYTCEVTNPAVDSLTLYSRPVTLFVKTEPLTQIITFDSIPDKTYGDQPFVLSATSDANLKVFFEIVSGSAYLSNDTLMITGAGEVMVKAFNAGDDIHLPTDVERSFWIAKAEQSITFDTIPDKILGDKPITLMALASSELPVSYISDGPALLNENILTLTDTGTLIITAAQAGNENYLPAEEVTRSFKVKSPTFSLSGKVFTETGHVAGSGAVSLYIPNEVGRLTKMQTGVLAEDGSYAFSELKSGNYSVGFVPDDTSYLSTYLGNIVIRSESTLISLSQSIGNQNITLVSKPKTLSGNLTISGVLVLEENAESGRILTGHTEVEGLLLSGVNVYLLSNSGEVVASDITDAAGKFSFPNLSSGSFQFRADYEGRQHDADHLHIEVDHNDIEVTALVAKEGYVEVQRINVITGTQDELIQTPTLLYPNPTDGKFAIQFDNFWLGGSIQIQHISGKELVQSQIKNTEILINLQNEVAGIYIITLQKGEAREVLRVNIY